LQKGSEWSDEELENHLNKPFSDLDVEQPEDQSEHNNPSQASATATTAPAQATTNKVVTPFTMEGIQSAESGTEIAYNPAKGKPITYTKNKNGKWVNSNTGKEQTQKSLEKLMSGTNPATLSFVTAAPASATSPAAPQPIHKPTAEHYANAVSGSTVEYKPIKGKPITYTKNENGKWVNSNTGKEQTQKSFEKLMSGTNPETLTMIPPIAGQAGAQPAATVPVTAPVGASTSTESTVAAQPATSASNPFTQSAYTQQRKDGAVWAKSKQKGDKAFRETTEKAWAQMSSGEKEAAFSYTSGSGKFNRPLSGYEGGWSVANYEGVGKVDLNYEGAGEMIKDLTSAIDKSVSEKDAWLQRGTNLNGMAGLLGLRPKNTYTKTEIIDGLKNAQKSGKTATNNAFTSCGSAKSTGFDGNVLVNVYCPKGTKMLYAEPFSSFAEQNVGGSKWDGKKKQTKFGYEFETIIQRGTGYRITKFETSPSGKIYVDMEVVSQITP
jgi:hypothetical protein